MTNLFTESRVTDGLWNDVWRIRTDDGSDMYFKRFEDHMQSPLFTGTPFIGARDTFARNLKTHLMASEALGASSLTIPRVLAVMPHRHSYLMAAVPRSFGALLSSLQSGEFPTSLATVLAPGLSLFHSFSHSYTEAPEYYDRGFVEYKLNLQFDAAAKMLGDRELQYLSDFVRDFRTHRECVVHGDLNSRNILYNPIDGALAVIDFEQSYVGAPEFDIAYILSELVICGAVEGVTTDSVSKSGRSFLENYIASAELSRSDAREMEMKLTILTAVQVLYRIEGPTRSVWTGHLDDESRANLTTTVTKWITENPKIFSAVV